MSAHAVFVDTSVLCNLLAIPHKCQNRDPIGAEFKVRRARAELIVPVTAVIETGNHVAQIKTGDERRTCAQRFAAVIERTLNGRAPWALNTVEWGAPFLRSLLDGAGTHTPLVGLATAGVGCGDLAILAEMDGYRARTAGVRVDLWTLDEKLAAYSERSG